jgi:pilin isopeptide linkage protein
MKKFLSMLLAVVLVLSLGTVAFADGETKTYTDQSTVTLTKTYNLEGAGTSPTETFSFSTLKCTSVTDAAAGVTTDNAPVPTIDTVKFEAGAAGDTTKGVQTATITLPTYTSVGVYTYTFTETDNKTAGVTYRSDAIKLVVTVIEQDGKVRVAGVYTESSGEKSGEFENTYSAGSLNVTKTVTGPLGDKTKEFNVTVTFTAPKDKTVNSTITYVDGTDSKTIVPENWTNGVATAEITLKDAETVSFTNIPYDVTYTVVEDDYTGDGYDSAKYAYVDETTTATTKIIDSAKETATITNNKGADPDTGITLDSMPYVVMLVVVCAGLFVVLAKKRAAREN